MVVAGHDLEPPKNSHLARLHAPPSFDTEWETEAETLTLCVSKCAFDGGGERNVFHARFHGSAFEWVAKESKHIDPGGFEAEVEFHKRSLVTQSTSAAWAGAFNYAVDNMGLGLPAVEVNRCYLVVVDSRPLFVEPKVLGSFVKWNSNHGVVHTWRPDGEQPAQPDGEEAARTRPGGIGAHSTPGTHAKPTTEDVPQCFTQ